MNSAIQYIKYNFIIMFKQWQILLFTFVVIPIIFSVFLSVSMADVYNVEPEPARFSVHLVNHDNTEAGAVVNRMFERLAEQQIIVIEENAQNADYLIEVPETYGTSLQTGEVESFRITLAEGVSQEGGEAVAMYLQPISHHLQAMIQTQKYIDDVAVAEQIIQEVHHITENTKMNEQQISTKSAPTSRQYFSITIISYLMLSIFSSIMLSSTKASFAGLRKRFVAFPFKPIQRTIYDWIVYTITYSLILGMYIIFWRLFDRSTFVGNPILYVSIIILLIGFISSAAGLIVLYIDESWSIIVSTIVSLIWIVFSGAMPWDKIGNVTMLKNNIVSATFIRPFELIFHGEGLASYTTTALILFCWMVGNIILTIQIQQKREAY